MEVAIGKLTFERVSSKNPWSGQARADKQTMRMSINPAKLFSAT
jgi:hypothetical protein